jgi:pyridinium-3,5-bisthiocarboxylic acid mononucleotide nickel chelatase
VQGGRWGVEAPNMHHVHLDPVGGLAGDMFVAALLDADPELEGPVIRAAEAAAPVRCRAIPIAIIS